MKKALRLFACFLLTVLVLLQFWRPAKNISTTASTDELAARHPVPPAVKDILQRACYDCHSDNTRYPWYAEVQPVRWWLDSHVNDGKRHLNFSAFGSYSTSRAVDKLGEIADEMESHAMPLPSYLWAHPEARLTPEEISLVAAWADALIEELDP